MAKREVYRGWGRVTVNGVRYHGEHLDEPAPDPEQVETAKEYLSMHFVSADGANQQTVNLKYWAANFVAKVHKQPRCISVGATIQAALDLGFGVTPLGDIGEGFGEALIHIKTPIPGKRAFLKAMYLDQGDYYTGAYHGPEQRGE